MIISRRVEARGAATRGTLRSLPRLPGQGEAAAPTSPALHRAIGATPRVPHHPWFRRLAMESRVPIGVGGKVKRCYDKQG